MTVIELADEQAAALKAKANAAGLTLEAWLKQLADAEREPPPAAALAFRRLRISFSTACAMSRPKSWPLSPKTAPASTTITFTGGLRREA